MKNKMLPGKTIQNAKHALKILIKDAEKQLTKAVNSSDWTSASTSRSYLNGLEVAKRIIDNVWRFDA